MVMSYLREMRPLPILLLSAAIWATGCHNNNQQSANNQQSTDQSNPNTDPAQANLAADNGEASAPAEETSSGNSSVAYNDANYAEEQPTYTAPEAPPALPDYSQPPCPGDGYIWTPGYWGYASSGYYWVPGAWVQAPYEGALWTPGYWGYSKGRYAYYPGHWGTHIGYYGGINYGDGYTGLGYEGGYWKNGHFAYNRDVDNVKTNVVHNVYEYRVPDQNRSHVSFQGGSGGVNVHPRPQEVTASREPRAAPMQTQLQVRDTARNDLAQFAKRTNNHPAKMVKQTPVPADRDVHPQPPQRGGSASNGNRNNRTEPVGPEPARRPEPQKR
jgi:hypothetical protein